MSNIILSFDTSIDCCSVAIYKNKYVYSLSEKCKKKYTTQILPMIQKILFQTQTKFRELNYIAFSKGPGNFTGIRIAASIAYSLSITLKIPLISISTLAIMAEKAWRKYKKKHIIVAINAKRKEVYWAKYIRTKQSYWTGENTESLLQKELIDKEIKKLKNVWTLVGNGLQHIENNLYKNINKTEIVFPNAKDIIPFALFKIKNTKKNCSENNSLNYLNHNFKSN